MPPAERIVRVILGAIGGPLLGIFVAAPATGVAEVTLWALAAIGTVDLVASGIAGFCPLWRFVSAPWTPRART